MAKYSDKFRLEIVQYYLDGYDELQMVDRFAINELIVNSMKMEYPPYRREVGAIAIIFRLNVLVRDG